MTEEEELRAWSGTYCSNDYQLVTDEDAFALSRALYSAIAAHLAETAWKQGQTLDVRVIRSLADHAAKGGFCIG